VSNGSGEAQYRHTIKRSEAGAVVMTHVGRSFQPEEYPRPLSVGESYRSSVFGGGGLVLETPFVPGVDL
jgi:hypothetical protein